MTTAAATDGAAAPSKEGIVTPLLLTLALSQAGAPPVALLRAALADVAVSQARAIDPRWQEAQRDCAGLVRFALREAHRRVWPVRLRTPLFQGPFGPTHFADAQSLLAESFTKVGREVALALTGDLLAFRQPRLEGDSFHLMVVVRPDDPAHGRPHVVYHPGSPGAAVRAGPLDELLAQAPAEWRPSPSNPSFLGVFRFKEWP